MDAPDLVPRKDAMLCANCDRISAWRNGRCPGCGSEAMMRLDLILNPEHRQLLKDLEAMRQSAPAVRRIFDFVAGDG